MFVEGCARVNQIPERKANEIFDLLEKFAGYGFNKSHSAAYALISYQTAYLKANYPLEFMAALLSNEINNTDKISVFVAECKRMGLDILAPDVNRSSLKFAPEWAAGDSSEASAKAIRLVWRRSRMWEARPWPPPLRAARQTAPLNRWRILPPASTPKR
jgi:DNA polymerase III alpha subunit